MLEGAWGGEGLFVKPGGRVFIPSLVGCWFDPQMVIPKMGQNKMVPIASPLSTECSGLDLEVTPGSHWTRKCRIVM